MQVGAGHPAMAVAQDRRQKIPTPVSRKAAIDNRRSDPPRLNNRRVLGLADLAVTAAALQSVRRAIAAEPAPAARARGENSDETS